MPGDSVLTYAQKTAFRKKFIKDYIRSYPYWRTMLAKGRVMKSDGGERVNVPYETAPSTGYSYGRDSAIPAVTQKGEIVQAFFDYGALALDTKSFGWDRDRQGKVGSISTGTVADDLATRIEMLENHYLREHNDRLWSGTNAPYGGGTDKDFLGLENQVVASPSSGTHGGLSRSTYDELQNQQISGAAGPSTDWEADAWERLLTLRVAILNHQMDWNGEVKPDICFVTEGSYVDIVNLAYNQNTNVGVNVRDVETVGGVIPIVNHLQDANTVYLLTSSTICIYYPPGWDSPIELDTRSELEDRMNPRDTIAIMKSELVQVVEAPFLNGVITSAG